MRSGSFLSAAFAVLQDAGKPLHSKEITDIAIKRALIDTTGKTPDATMNARIYVDIKTKGVLSDFKKVQPHTFAINDKKIALQEEVKPDQILEELTREEAKEVEGGYTGRAGEYAVISELLFHGYNVAPMTVDVGIDVIATKANETFNIQVKTRNIKGPATDFNVRVSSFERHNTGRTFYIFVLRKNKTQNYLILPLLELEKAIAKHHIYTVGKEKLYRIVITDRDDKIYLGGKQGHDVAYYLNKWDIIK